MMKQLRKREKPKANQRTRKKSLVTVQKFSKLMIYSRAAAFIVAALVFNVHCSANAAADRLVKPIHDGVRLVQDIDTDAKSPLIISALKFDPNNPNITLKAALGQDIVLTPDPTKGRETVSSFVARSGALAAINADYFDWTGDPLGLAIIDGELVSEPYPDRAVFGLMADGKAVFDSLTTTATVTASGAMRNLDGINKVRGRNQLVVYSSIFGESTQTGANTESVEAVLTTIDLPIRANREITATVQSIQPICNTSIPVNGLVLSASGDASAWLSTNLRTGDTVKISVTLNSSNGIDWGMVRQAVGGGPWLVKNKQILVTAEKEKFDGAFSNVRHPRTAVGVTSAGELLLVAVDGRQSISRGATLPEMASIMQKLGAVNAINLDGGGSTSLSVRGVVANSPSGGNERPVATMLVLSAPAAPGKLRFKFASTDLEVISGQPVRPPLVDLNSGRVLDAKAAQNIIWGTRGGIGFVSLDGRFTPIKAGKGSLVAISGDFRAEMPVTVIAGAPAKIEATLQPDVSGASNRSSIRVRILDANGNFIPDHGFRVSGKKGQVDAPLGVTNSTGEGYTGVTWEYQQGGVVTIAVGKVTKEVRQPDTAVIPAN